MRLLVNVTLSLLMLAVCVWLVWPSAHEQHELRRVLEAMSLAEFGPYLAGYVALLATTHFFRAYRWNNLLRPIGAELPLGKLMSISSIGFMAILALPARLGEFVRPALLRQRGRVSGAAVLGTVAVERIVDGLIVSILVFVCCFAQRNSPTAPGWMMPVAYASLGIFVSAMTFLAFALRWPDRTVRICVTISGARLVPKVAGKIEELLHKLISGFVVLKDRRNLALFVLWSAAYWVANGMGMWVLARGMNLDISVVGAFATMGIVAVGITLPNSPGLVGQFHWATAAGLSLYLPQTIVKVEGLAYALLLHGIQVVWYVGVGAIAMLTSGVSFADMLRKAPEDAAAAAARREVA